MPRVAVVLAPHSHLSSFGIWQGTANLVRNLLTSQLACRLVCQETIFGAWRNAAAQCALQSSSTANARLSKNRPHRPVRRAWCERSVARCILALGLHTAECSWSALARQREFVPMCRNGTAANSQKATRPRRRNFTHEASRGSKHQGEGGE